MSTIGWDAYVFAVRQRLESQSRDVRPFLSVQQSDGRIRQVLDGAVLVGPSSGIGFTTSPNSAIHDWTGAVYLPRLTPAQVFATLNQAEPATCRRSGSGCILRADYESLYCWPSPDRWWSISNGLGMPDKAQRSSVELQSAYVRRLSCVTRAIEVQHGTLIEVQAIVLSPFPGWVAWLMQPIISRICRNALVTTLCQTKDTCSNISHLFHEHRPTHTDVAALSRAAYPEDTRPV
jgi:hypothetical protein